MTTLSLARRWERASARRLLRLPRPWLLRLAGGTPIERDGQRLDEQAQLVLALSRMVGLRPMHELTVPQARAATLRSCLSLAPDSVPMADVTVRAFRGPLGPIVARVYRPRARRDDPTAPALVYFHGGGWVVGDLDGYEPLCRTLAEQSGCVVVSVDYRLAPEHRFPAAAEDAVAAFRGVHSRAVELGLDPTRLAVGGDSAGGNLAAVVSQQLRNTGGPVPAFQLLVYPALDPAGFTRSRALFGQGFFLEEPTIQWFLGHYFEHRADMLDLRAAPLRATDLAGLPPALILVAGFDPLRDEGIVYATRLRDAGVPVELRNDTGMFHGYFSTSGGMDVSADAVAHAARALRGALA
jgi:acetyl esterase